MIKINKSLKEIIKKKVRRFKKSKNKERVFQELCFCILVANNNLEKVYRIWSKIKDNFLNYNLKKLQKSLKNAGYRFYRKRAEYIIQNRKKIYEILNILKEKDSNYIRDWLVRNIKGIGYKEASHFLRNMGYKDLAILDRHILRFLLNNKIIKEIPKALNKNIYLEIENQLKIIAKKNKVNLAELDFYIFYLQTKRFPIK